MKGILDTQDALFPLMGGMTSDDGLVIHEYHNGTVTAETPAGNPIALKLSGYFADEGHAAISLASDTPETFTLRLRIPA